MYSLPSDVCLGLSFGAERGVVLNFHQLRRQKTLQVVTLVKVNNSQWEMTAVQERERYRIACIQISIGRSKRGTHMK